MGDSQIYGLGEECPQGITLESALNQGEDLPYGLYKPGLNEEEISWHCGYNQEGGITSVYRYRKGTEKPQYLEQEIPSLEVAQAARQEFLKEGWKFIQPPKVNFTVGGKK